MYLCLPAPSQDFFGFCRCFCYTAKADFEPSAILLPQPRLYWEQGMQHHAWLPVVFLKDKCMTAVSWNN